MQRLACVAAAFVTHLVSFAVFLSLATVAFAQQGRLPNTAPWEHPGATPEELADQMIAGIDRFLLKETHNASSKQQAFWKRDLSSVEAYQKSIEPNRDQLRWIYGLRDQRVPFAQPWLMATLSDSGVRGTVTVQAEQADQTEQADSASEQTEKEQSGSPKNTHLIRLVKWPVVEGVVWEGIWIQPVGEVRYNVIVVPGDGQTPESLVFDETGRSPVLPLLQQGVRVVIPHTVSRKIQPRRNAQLTDREFLYRTSFEMGRHPAGYEVQALLALVDYLKPESLAESVQASSAKQAHKQNKVGVYGIGDGAIVSLVAAAVDTRIDAVVASGYFGSRENLWQEPIDRNLFGFVEKFGDANLATLIAPRPLIIEATKLPEQELSTNMGAPGKIWSPDVDEARQELSRAREILSAKTFGWKTRLVIPSSAAASPLLSASEDQEHAELVSPVSPEMFFTSAAIAALQEELQPAQAAHGRKQIDGELVVKTASEQHDFDKEADERQARLVSQITAYNQKLLADSENVRKQFFSKLNTSSLAKFEETVEPYREYFSKQVIGEFEQPLLEPRPRSRKIQETEHWTSYEVMLDVFPEVVTHGVLLIPKNIPTGEKRPVVVCQHGLEGLPQHTFEGAHRAYHDYGAKLAELGFVVFAPQNPYRGEHAFRTLQRKANPLGKSLFSIIVPQHEQLTTWLGSLPEVDEQRIAFYGLSYGGKTAMRVPPLVKNYALSICSADFNDWIAKNASVSVPFSYVWTKEYEIYEFDLGNTFNYAEMATLIAPRPFMVERGHFDGVGPDPWVASEFAKVRWVYKVQLGLGDRAEIEWFVGPHAINGQGTFEFLKKQFRYPEPATAAQP